MQCIERRLTKLHKTSHSITILKGQVKNYFKTVGLTIVLVILVSVLTLNFIWSMHYTLRIIKSSYMANNIEYELTELRESKLQLGEELNQLERHRIFLSKKMYESEEKLENSFPILFKLHEQKKNVSTELLKIEKKFAKIIKIDETLDKCFNYSQCSLNSKLKIYLFDRYFLNLTKSIDNVFEIVEAKNESCLSVYFIKNEKDSQNLRDKKDLIKVKDNLLIVNLIDHSNLLIHRNDLNSKSLKCSLYASFSLNAVNPVSDNLFFHFSALKSDTWEYQKIIYENQKQNKLLFTHNRKYFITYYQSESIGYTLNMNKVMIKDIKCEYSKCLDILERLETLSNSTFLLIDNQNILNSTLWSNLLTKQLIEALSVGTIPLLLDLDSKLPLDDLINWNEIVIRYPKSAIRNLEEILLNLNQADIISRRIRASKVYNRYFRTPEIQFNTLITAIRERIRLPATAIGDYVDKDVEKYPQINELNVNMTKYTDKSIQINDDEYLGPVKDNGALQQKKEYQFNMTFNNYFSWNVLFYPFNIMPTTPFDQFLPIDLKYSSIDEPSDDPNYFFGGSFGGQYFSDKLRGNTDDNEQFTMVILTFNRERLLTSVLLEYFKMPFLNQIIIVWNSIDIQPTNEFYYIFRKELKLKLLTLVYGKGNSLGNRFLPYEFIRTEAIIALDDDTQLRNDEIVFAFRIWRENRDRLVGFPSRYHSWNPLNQTFRYRTEMSCEYSMILTGGAFYHRFYHYYYHHLLDKRILEMIDEFKNCEDVAFNFMISDLTRKPPLKVTTKTSFSCKLCSSDEDIQESLSANKLHFERRSTCVNYFNLIYGYNPLLYSQYRGSSLLFAFKNDTKIEKCFDRI